MPPNLCICVCACVHAHTQVRARIELRMGLAKVGRSVGGMVGKVYHILYESSIADRWRGQLANRAWSGRSDGWMNVAIEGLVRRCSETQCWSSGPNCETSRWSRGGERFSVESVGAPGSPGWGERRREGRRGRPILSSWLFGGRRHAKGAC